MGHSLQLFLMRTEVSDSVQMSLLKVEPRLEPTPSSLLVFHIFPQWLHPLLWATVSNAWDSRPPFSPTSRLDLLGYVLARPCLTLCDPMGSSPPGSSVHGNFQARILEWVAIFSCRGSSPPRDLTHISCISSIGGGFFITEPLGSRLISAYINCKAFLSDDPQTPQLLFYCPGLVNVFVTTKKQNYTIFRLLFIAFFPSASIFYFEIFLKAALPWWVLITLPHPRSLHPSAGLLVSSLGAS